MCKAKEKHRNKIIYLIYSTQYISFMKNKKFNNVYKSHNLVFFNICVITSYDFELITFV